MPMNIEPVKKWLGATLRRPDGTLACIPTRFAALDVGVAQQLALDARQIISESTSSSSPKADPSSSKVLLIFDQCTAPFVDAVESALVEHGSFSPHDVLRYCVPDETNGSHPAPELQNSMRVYQVMRKPTGTTTGDDGGDDAVGVALAVAIGSGTINDLTKYAAHLAHIPYLSYATAASMNGYNSPIVALYIDGLKATTPATPPVGIYADPHVLVSAPKIMNLAGLGDLCSKPFAGADAVIASIIAEKPAWHLPSDIVQEAFVQVLKLAHEIGQDDPSAIACLLQALWISGFSMVLAGTSAPASGGEHLWSHRIDMYRHDAGLPHLALHGTQVGIACGLVQPLFQLCAQLSQSQVQQRLDPHQPLRFPDQHQPLDLPHYIQQRHSDLNQTSQAAILPQAQAKYDVHVRRALRAQIVNKWDAIRAELHAANIHAARVEKALVAANAPRDPSTIAIDIQEAKRLLLVCRDIRNRFTILDLTAELLGEDAITQCFPTF